MQNQESKVKDSTDFPTIPEFSPLAKESDDNSVMSINLEHS